MSEPEELWGIFDHLGILQGTQFTREDAEKLAKRLTADTRDVHTYCHYVAASGYVKAELLEEAKRVAGRMHYLGNLVRARTQSEQDELTRLMRENPPRVEPVAIAESKGITGAWKDLAKLNAVAFRDSHLELTQAQQRIEELEERVSEWKDVANWLLRCGRYLPQFVRDRIANLNPAPEGAKVEETEDDWSNVEHGPFHDDPASPPSPACGNPECRHPICNSIEATEPQQPPAEPAQAEPWRPHGPLTASGSRVRVNLPESDNNGAVGNIAEKGKDAEYAWRVRFDERKRNDGDVWFRTEHLEPVDPQQPPAPSGDVLTRVLLEALRSFSSPGDTTLNQRERDAFRWLADRIERRL